jgi:F-type H+-transporting ATPase subunit a
MTEHVSTDVAPAEPTFFQVHEEIPTITSPIVGDLGVLTIATSTITVMFITVLLVALCMVVARAKLIPSKFQHILEMFYEYVSGFVTSILGDKERASIVVPYVGALMLYLIVANLLPMIPFLNSFYLVINGAHVPLLRGATTDFNTTFGLALAVIVTMQIIGMREQGVFGYLSHFIQVKQVYKGFKHSFGEGLTSIVGFLVGLIEIVSEFAKVLSLSLRLFGNMFAHEVLTIILLGVFAVAVPAVWMGMGLLVGVVQSIVFVALVTVYYSLVLKKKDGSH